MKKEEIIQGILDYLNNDKAKYAVMVSGPWGSGKTYLYEHGISEAIETNENGKNERKVNTYISLYGMATVEELTREIVLNYIIKSKLNGNVTEGKIFQKLEKITGILSKMITVSLNNVSVNFNDIKGVLQENVKFQNMVICFDDLERCNIPINIVFGVINNLVEHCGCKVIILADEENIGNMYANLNIENKYLSIINGRKIVFEKDCNKEDLKGLEAITVKELKELNKKVYEENYLYKDIKEKVIGVTFPYQVEIKKEFDTIIKESINSEELRRELHKKKEDILQYMEKCDNSNIRITKNWMINFERIFKVIKKNYDGKYFNEIFNNFLIYSIRVACALGKNKPLYKWKNDEMIGEGIYLEDSFLFNTCGYKFIDMLYIQSILNPMEVYYAANYIMNKMKKEEEQLKRYSRGEALNKLHEWKYYEDEDIDPIICDLLIELKDKKYVYQDYPNIIAYVILLHSKRLYNGSVDTFIDAMEKNIKEEKGKVEIERLGNGTWDDEAIEHKYYKYLEKIENCIESKNHALSQNDINKSLVESNDNWAEDLYAYCKKNADTFLQEYKFFYYIDIEALYKKIVNAKPKEIYIVGDVIRGVYRFGNIYEFYVKDIAKVKEFVEMLNKWEPEKETRKIAKAGLINILKEKLKDLGASID